jgi:hypothetical protein
MQLFDRRALCSVESVFRQQGMAGAWAFSIAPARQYLPRGRVRIGKCNRLPVVSKTFGLFRVSLQGLALGMYR